MKRIAIAGSHIFGLKDRFKNYSQTYVNQDYVTSIIAAGGLPVILPIIDSEKLANKYLKEFDGLVLTGGSDIDPKMYKQKNHPKTKGINKFRDISDALYIKAALKNKKPILGICRGMQIVNAVMGGTLHQDLSLFKNESKLGKHDQKNNPGKKTYDITIDKNSLLYKWVKKTKLNVNHFHHQIVDKLAPNFIVTAKSKDGIIEAMETTKGTLIMALQWHPEMLGARKDIDNLKIFKEFIKTL